MDQIKRLLGREKFQPVRFGEGTTDGQIQLAESELGVTLPASYKSFLSCLGWIESPYISVFGLGSDVDSRSDLIGMTKAWWYEVDIETRLPQNFVPVVDDGSGNLYCLDVLQMRG